jgi:hypothetical protein
MRSGRLLALCLWAGLCAVLCGVLDAVLPFGAARAYDELSPFWSPDSSGSGLYATDPPALFVHNAGPLHVMVTNMGVIGNPRSGVDVYAARWRGGEYLHSVELWVGAMAEDDLPHVSNGYEFRPSLDPLDTIYPSFEGAPGGMRAGFSLSNGDDDGDGLVDEEFLNGKDDDGDGLIDEDYAAISQQMFSCEYTDDRIEATSSMADHLPLHLLVRQNTYAWSSPGENEFIGIDFQITNTGADELRDVYVGCAFDGDIGRKTAAGYWADDRAWIEQIDTTYVDDRINYYCNDTGGGRRDCSRRAVRIDMLRMADVPGRLGGGRLDDLPTDSNGTIGLVLLGHTTDMTGTRAPVTVEPRARTIFQKRQGFALDDFTRYRYLTLSTSGDSTVTPGDYAGVLSVGPFPALLPGETVELHTALVIGATRTELIENALEAIRIHRGAWRDLDNDLRTGCWGAETCLSVPRGGSSFTWMDPCVTPARRVTIKNNDCSRLISWVNDDCSCCTPIQLSEDLCEGWETLVPWVGRLAPPVPAVSTDDPQRRIHAEQDHRIVLEWDNSPELVADPLSGRMIFCGYRIWRVEGWTRPYGSLGPTPEDWQLIAELVYAPVGSQLDLSAHIDPAVPVAGRVRSPVDSTVWLDKYPVGHYAFSDTLGLKNGMLYFYDITSFGCWVEDGDYYETGQPPAAIESEGVRPRWAAVTRGDWTTRVAVVPNPYHGSAEWDLTPSRADPQGARVEFIGLPNSECDIRIYSLAGDLVQWLHHDGRGGDGSQSWNFLSRNGQDVASGVYLYAVTCGGKTAVGRFTVIR